MTHPIRSHAGHRPTRARGVRPHPLTLALACALAGATPGGWLQAQTLPTGAAVARGQASIVTQGNQMTVTSGPNAVLNWQSFSIGAGQSVRFEQPSSSSQVLNRVLGRDPSHIAGRLSSNGTVWLLNPNGVLFGRGARVDVAGLVASTLNINDADWQARRYSLLGGNSTAGQVVNQGEIRTTLGGQVLLLGGQAGVRNEGLIEAAGGQVMLAAGASVDLADSTSPQLAVRVTAPAGEAVNLGQMLSSGGRIDLQAAMVNQQGIVRADSLAGGPAGEVRLQAGGDLTLAAGSHTGADGGQGGRVVALGGTTLVAGSVSAQGSQGAGGQVRLLGEQVGLLAGADVNASGRAGGGQVLVGGGLQGADAAVPNARATYMDAGATVRADAGEHGQGGLVVLWSDKATRAYGTLSARGGAQGGDGGLIETSGGWLDARPLSVSTLAPRGTAGTWLLDPNDILISDGSLANDNVSAGPNFRSTGDSATINTATIISALQAGNSVTVTTATQSGSQQAGNITMQGSLSLPFNGDVTPPAVSLTLNAARHIDLDHVSITSLQQPLNVNLNAGTGGAGGIRVIGGSINTLGTITLGGPSRPCGTAGCSPVAGATGTTDAGRGFGVSIQGAALGASRITVRGASAIDNQTHGGVFIDGSSTLSANQIELAGWTGSNANFDQYGVKVSGNLRALDRITIDGTSRVNGPGSVEGAAVGVDLDSSSSLELGPTALDDGGGNLDQQFGKGPRSAEMRRALAADPNRFLRITGLADDRSGMFSDSVSVQGSVLVTDKAGITIRGDGGPVSLLSSFFDASDAGNLLVNGTGALVMSVDDLLVPNAEPTRLTNSGGVSVFGTVFGLPSEFTIDTSGTVRLGDGFPGLTLDLGSSPLTVRGNLILAGTEGDSVSVQAGRTRLLGQTVELGASTLFTSSATGDAITVAGRTGNVDSLQVAGSNSPLATSNGGRWLVYATDPTDSANFQPGGLSHDFKQYNATPGSGTVLGTGNGFLFSLAPQLQLSADIVGPTSKTYSGSTSSSATIDEGGLTGLLPGDSLLDSPQFGPLRYASANAGNNIPFVVSLVGGLPEVADATERPVYGYGFSSTVQGTRGTIRPRTVTVDNLSSLNKVYDGTATVALQGATLGGLVAGESLTLLPGTVAFNNANAGVGKPVTGTFDLSDGPGGQARNYRLADGGVLSTTADISPRPVSVTGATVADKVYDGTTVASVSGGTLVGVLTGQNLTVTAGSTTFDTKNAGVGKAVTGALALADGTGPGAGLASNYRLTNGNTLSLSGTILPRPVGFASATVADKVYDGTTLASAQVGALQGVVAGESIGATVNGQFQTSQVGTDKPVFAAVTLTDGVGGLASNYVFPGGGFSARASITARPVTVLGVAAADKPYDGTTTAGLTAQTFQGVVPGETLTLASQASFDTKAVGTGKTVTGRIALADGTGQASNYALVNPGAFTGQAAIVPRGLTVTSASAADKVYDGTLATTASNFTLSGVLPGEQVSVSAGNGRFADPNVGAGKPVTATATGLAGPDVGNYTLVSAAVQTRAGITPATALYVAERTSAEQGQPLPPLTGSVAGLVAGDTLESATTGRLLFTTSATPASPEGLYPVTGSGLNARNYVFSQAPQNATALSIVRLSTSSIGEPTATVPTPPALMAAIQPPPVVSSVSAHRALDALPVLQSAPPNFVFRPIDLDAYTEQDVASMLAARDRYKKGIFADAIRELEQNPAAADVPACQTVEQAAAGNCLITESLKPALRARMQVDSQLALLPLPAPTPPASVQPPAPATPTAPAAPAATPAPALPPVAVAPAAPRAQPAAPTLRLPAARAVRTAALPQIQRKWALLIGTDVYADVKIPQLDNAVSDVNAVARVLEDKLGYQTLVVRNGSKAEILRAFNQLAAVVSPADSVAIYYAGHGELIEKLNLGFWQPTDADATRAETWISNTDIGKLLGQLGASQVVLVSDSCFSGSLVSDERIRAGSVVPDAATLLSRRAAVVMSSGGNEPVFDSGKNGHSTFAWSLMKSLENVASWRPGSNIFEQVRFQVARQVPQRPQYGASRLGGHQTGADYVFEQRQLDTVTK